jgi:hypothetical protein
MPRRSLLIRWCVASSRLQCRLNTWVWRTGGGRQEGGGSAQEGRWENTSRLAQRGLMWKQEARKTSISMYANPVCHAPTPTLTSASRSTSSTVSHRRTATGASPEWRSSSEYLRGAQGQASAAAAPAGGQPNFGRGTTRQEGLCCAVHPPAHSARCSRSADRPSLTPGASPHFLMYSSSRVLG